MVLRKDGRLMYYRISKVNEYSRNGSGGNPPRGVIDEYTDILHGDSSTVNANWPRDAPSSCRFSLPTADRIYHIYCESNSEAQRWICALRQALDRKERLASLGAL